MNRIEEAIKYKHSGYNCTQSVLMAYKDKLNIKEEDILKLSSGFLLGMGNMKGTCGALIAANMLLGVLNESKKRMMTLSANLVDEFEKKSGALICSDLKGIKTGKVLCSCDDCIKNAIEILENILNEKE
ncbi:MAG: C-GCAxxG-C-C family protein [Acholeplasmatales bacterium]|nr:C-GCAxxG-C-C family protein [Acholeplasmatales bacterium]